MVKHLLIASSVFTLCFVQVAAQSTIYRRVLSHEVMRHRMAETPSLVDTRRNIEQQLYDFSTTENIDSLTVHFSDSIAPLPLRFHIVYHSTSDYVDIEQIVAQINALNRDFGPAASPGNPYFKYNQAISAGPMIRFCLPESGGITYYQVNHTDWTFQEMMEAPDFGVAPPDSPQQYINIWVANLADDIAGYAQMPGGSAESDGIVIDYQLFGPSVTAVPPYDQGKMLTHLMGNYLGLYSLWGETFCGDDYVWDTPVHNAPNYYYFERGHVSTCTDNQAEMLENFMDLTPDSVRTLFTRGQVMRMYATLTGNGARSGLATGIVASCIENPQPGVSDRFIPDAEAFANHIRIFPNPSDGVIQIVLNTEGVDLQIFNETGSLVYQQMKIPDALSISCQNWANGLYMIVFKSPNGQLATKRISVQHP